MDGRHAELAMMSVSTATGTFWQAVATASNANLMLLQGMPRNIKARQTLAAVPVTVDCTRAQRPVSRARPGAGPSDTVLSMAQCPLPAMCQ